MNNAVNPPQYVYAYYGTASGLTNRCGQTSSSGPRPWSSPPRDGTETRFLGWAGDCSGTGTCTLKAGADKTVVAIFGPPGGGHGNFTSPAVHGPAYFDFLSGASPLKCTTCHGPTLAGQANAPSCSGCHTAAGWASWQDNCSFCHGATTAAAKAGYAFASHPSWSAPPDALSQRFTGSPAPDRTGAHQAHLLGVTPSGLSVAPPFTCATCHPVPTDLTHVDGAANRAQVVLSGAGQASLPPSLGTYNQGSGTCTTYCHGNGGSPAWSATGMQCGACHGVPPLGSHPYTGSDLTACAGCHPETMNASGALIVGGKHLDGNLQFTGGHGDYSSPAEHGPRFFDSISESTGVSQCSSCHGATYDGGTGPSCNDCHTTTAGWTGWDSNCSFCHGTKNATTQAGYSVASPPHLVGPARRHRPAARPGPRRGRRPAPAPTRPT